VGDERQTRAWKRLRANFRSALPLPCRRCGVLIMPWDRWELGHVVDVAAGGTADDGAWPEHYTCNRRGGGVTPAPVSLPPSRQW